MTPDPIVTNSVKVKTPVSGHSAGAGRMPGQTVEARIAQKPSFTWPGLLGRLYTFHVIEREFAKQLGQAIGLPGFFANEAATGLKSHIFLCDTADAVQHGVRIRQSTRGSKRSCG